MQHLLQHHLEWLGRRVEDRVTGIHGIVTSVTFDLYGCVQYLVNPGLDKEGKTRESYWFDFNRVKETTDGAALGRVMEPPVEWLAKGPSDKPAFSEKPTC